ncbi:hypothetical protein [Streptomyces mexicanus]|uniref:hypothetical protein n=1 Tax=Streptomyces mexicanus TaxID=178566 RepID=UPI00365C2C79
MTKAERAERAREVPRARAGERDRTASADVASLPVAPRLAELVRHNQEAVDAARRRRREAGVDVPLVSPPRLGDSLREHSLFTLPGDESIQPVQEGAQ